MEPAKSTANGLNAPPVRAVLIVSQSGQYISKFGKIGSEQQNNLKRPFQNFRPQVLSKFEPFPKTRTFRGVESRGWFRVLRIPKARKFGNNYNGPVCVRDWLRNSAILREHPVHHRSGSSAALGTETNLEPILKPANRPTVLTTEHKIMACSRGHATRVVV